MIAITNCDRATVPLMRYISIALALLVVMSFLHQLLDFALKLAKGTTKKGLFSTVDSRFSSSFSLKDSNCSCD